MEMRITVELLGEDGSTILKEQDVFDHDDAGFQGDVEALVDRVVEYGEEYYGVDIDA